MPGTYSLFGQDHRLAGCATPSCVASVAPKNLSSAVHMNGLLTTVAPCSDRVLELAPVERHLVRDAVDDDARTGTGSSIAGAPSWTNSAMTPASRRFTSSMNAGGKLHSRPTISPIFVLTSLLLP